MEADWTGGKRERGKNVWNGSDRNRMFYSEIWSRRSMEWSHSFKNAWISEWVHNSDPFIRSLLSGASLAHLKPNLFSVVCGVETHSPRACVHNLQHFSDQICYVTSASSSTCFFFWGVPADFKVDALTTPSYIKHVFSFMGVIAMETDLWDEAC